MVRAFALVGSFCVLAWVRSESAAPRHAQPPHPAHGTLRLTIEPPGAGTVVLHRQGPYPFGAGITFAAVPSPGFVFAGFAGDVTTTTSPAALALDGHKTVIARFAEARHRGSRDSR